VDTGLFGLEALFMRIMRDVNIEMSKGAKKRRGMKQRRGGNNAWRLSNACTHQIELIING